MAKAAHSRDDNLGEIVHGIVHDVGTLLSQHVDLLRGEVRQELHRAGDAVMTTATGGGLVAAGGLLSGLALAHLLHKATGLPLWCCYGAAAGTCAAAGAALVRRGGTQLSDLPLVPPQTKAAVEENLTWLKEQVSPAAT